MKFLARALLALSLLTSHAFATLQPLAWSIAYPGILTNAVAAPSIAGTDTLDAAGEYASFNQCTAPALAITHVGFRLQIATGSPTADVRIETIDAATGIPTGTLWATNTNIVTPTLTTTYATHALTATANIPAGGCWSTKIVYASGTSMQLQAYGGVVLGVGLPYAVTNTTGSAVKGTGAPRPWAIGDSATTFYPLRNLLPAASVAANAFNNTNSAEQGVRFQLPFDAQLVGVRVYLGTAVGDFNIIARDDAGTELSSSSTAFEGDVHLAGATSVVYIPFDNPVTLSNGVWYRVTQQPSSATNINGYAATLPTANHRQAWPGGENYYRTTFASAAWDDSLTTQVPFMDLLLKQLDDGVGGAASGRCVGC